MKKKYLAYFLLAMMALLFVLGFRACAKAPQPPKGGAVTVTVPAVPGKPTIAPLGPAAAVTDSALLAEVARYRQRYEHYKGQAGDLADRLAAMDAALLVPVGTDSLLTCEERAAILRAQVAALKDGNKSSDYYVGVLEAELTPKRDTGSERTAAYAFQWEINHRGQLLPGGFRYKVDLLPQVVEVGSLTVGSGQSRRNALSALVGFTNDDLRLTNGRPTYALQYQHGGKRLVATWQVQYPAGALAGVGWRW